MLAITPRGWRAESPIHAPHIDVGTGTQRRAHPVVGSFVSLIRSLPVALAFPGWPQYVDFLEWMLDDVLAQTLGSAGLAVIAFTILIKTLLLPLTVQSLRSSKAMQELQPKIKDLQKKYGKDRQRISQETMALYAAHRVNPMAGCLPMLMQIPIFFGLYQAISALSDGRGGASDLWGDHFLWLDNLGTADPYKILPILAGLFQFVQTKMMRPANQGKITDPQQAMMNTMMNFMPLMVIVFGWNFASGPVIYWATQSVFSVVQQWLITGWGSWRDWIPNLPDLPEHRRLGYRAPRPVEDPVVMSGEGGAAARPAGAMGWFQRKMEEAQQQAEARSRANQSSSSEDSAASPPGKRSRLQARVDATDTDPDLSPDASGAAKARARHANTRARASEESTAVATETVNTNGRHPTQNGGKRAPSGARRTRPTRRPDGRGSSSGRP